MAGICLSICIICQEIHQSWHEWAGSVVYTRERARMVAKHLCPLAYVLVVPAAQEFLRLRELVQSPWPIIPDRVASNGEGSFFC